MPAERIFRLTANPLAEPENLDRGYVSRVRDMLDAYAAAAPRNSTLMLHEDGGSPFLPYAVISWVVGRVPVSVHLATNSGGTYEVWGINAGESSISVFPRERLLYGLDPDLQSKIDKIRHEADARVKALLESESAALAQADEAVAG